MVMMTRQVQVLTVSLVEVVNYRVVEMMVGRVLVTGRDAVAADNGSVHHLGGGWQDSLIHPIDICVVQETLTLQHVDIGHQGRSVTLTLRQNSDAPSLPRNLPLLPGRFSRAAATPYHHAQPLHAHAGRDRELADRLPPGCRSRKRCNLPPPGHVNDAFLKPTSCPPSPRRRGQELVPSPTCFDLADKPRKMPPGPPAWGGAR